MPDPINENAVPGTDFVFHGEWRAERILENLTVQMEGRDDSLSPLVALWLYKEIVDEMRCHEAEVRQEIAAVGDTVDRVANVLARVSEAAHFSSGSDDKLIAKIAVMHDVFRDRGFQALEEDDELRKLRSLVIAICNAANYHGRPLDDLLAHIADLEKASKRD